jgi:hypothetical protein
MLVIALLLPSGLLSAQSAPQDRVAAFKQSLKENQQRLHHYQWVETTTVSVKGEEKSRTQKLCSYGPDGTVQKAPMGAPPQQQAEHGLRGRIIEKKKKEMSDYMKQAVALVHEYLPPDPQRIQAAKEAGKLSLSPSGASSLRLIIQDYLKPGDSLSINLNPENNSIREVTVASYLESPKDSITMDATFASLSDGANYVANSVLTAPAKHLQVVVQNSDYRKISTMTPPASPQPGQAARQKRMPTSNAGWSDPAPAKYPRTQRV